MRITLPNRNGHRWSCDTTILLTVLVSLLGMTLSADTKLVRTSISRQSANRLSNSPLIFLKVAQPPNERRRFGAMPTAQRRNSNIYRLPLKFISNGRPILVKGIRTALAPRAEIGLKKSASAVGSLPPFYASASKNIYRLLKESAVSQKVATRLKNKIIHLPTRFVTSGQPWRVLVMTEAFKKLGADRKITDRRVLETPAAQLYAEYVASLSAGRKRLSFKTK